MDINYYCISGDGEISKFFIDTLDREYIKHDDNSVWINEGWGQASIYSRSFDFVKSQLIEHLENKINRIKQLKESDL